MPTTEEDDPKFVVYQEQSVSKTLELRAELDTSLKAYRKVVASGQIFSDLVDKFYGRLGQRGVTREVLWESLRDLAGARLTRDLLWATSWRMAANVPRLKQRRPVPVWTHQSIRECCYAQVTDCSLSGRDSRNRVRHELKFLILTGTAAGETAKQNWNRRRQEHVAHYRNKAGQGFMFTRKRPGLAAKPSRFPFDTPKQFVGMRCLLVLTPEHSGEDPGFDELRFNGPTTEHNRELLKKRERIEPGYECPHNLDRYEVPCRVCPIGYKACPAGTHRHTYVYHECPRCEKKEAAFDPGSHSKVCIACDEHQTLHPEED